MAKEQQTLTLPQRQSESPVSTQAEVKNDLVLLAPTPELNPRNQILKDIAERANADADRDAVETIRSVDDDGEEVTNVTENSDTSEDTGNDITTDPVQEESASKETSSETPTPVQPSQFDPDQEYEVTELLEVFRHITL